MKVYVCWSPYSWKRYELLAAGKTLELLNEDNQRVHVKADLAQKEPPLMGFLAVSIGKVEFVCHECQYVVDLTGESSNSQDSFCKEHNRLLHKEHNGD